MSRLGFVGSLLFVTLIGSAAIGLAQQTGKGGKREQPEPKQSPLPDDKRLLAIHLDFVKKAEKLATEYENGKDWSKARDVYEQILKLVPQYPPAQAKRAELLRRESEADRVTFNVQANDGWQDTGVVVLVDKPVSLQVTGAWTFNLQVETNGEGLEIPKELRDFNPGCLIAMIVTGREEKDKPPKPFTVGAGKSLMPEETGRLFMRMYDINPKDNEGSLKVDIRGTFREGR